ncbi:hypothetical protein KFL01_29820 [Kocuria flava]|uniref:DUF3800 domain-containing protein n=2 Tax=Kocuria flava TaxID=446860 RepID=A0ABQ0X7S6_9MICC|nr:hypothetical protein KFL01_29820 [Kocuria flava]
MPPADDFQLHAWVDESMRNTNVSAPMYMLGAVVTDPLACEAARTELRQLVPHGRKLHWRDLDDRLKRRAVQAVASFDAAHMVVVASPLNPRKQERARAACMERLCWELGGMGVSRVVLESRTPSLNKRDDELIKHLRGKKSLPQGLRVDIELPSGEPMLWVPDQVLGAMGDAETGEERWMQVLGQSVTRVDICL